MSPASMQVYRPHGGHIPLAEVVLPGVNDSAKAAVDVRLARYFDRR